MRSLAFTAILLGCASLVYAQAPPQPPLQNLPATTVQLPTFSSFNVTTTVSVPDRGGIYIGGLDRGVDSTVSRSAGPIRNRSSSSSRTASGLSVHATIIDPAEMDAAVLAAAATKRGAPADSAFAKADSLSRAVGRGDGASAPPDSVVAIRERAASAAELETQELAGYFAKGRQAEAENKPAVAKIFYQMV